MIFNSGVKERKDGITVSVQGVNEKYPGAGLHWVHTGLCRGMEVLIRDIGAHATKLSDSH